MIAANEQFKSKTPQTLWGSLRRFPFSLRANLISSERFSRLGDLPSGGVNSIDFSGVRAAPVLEDAAPISPAPKPKPSLETFGQVYDKLFYKTPDGDLKQPGAKPHAWVSHFDEMRPVVLSAWQKGKKLCQDFNSPEFDTRFHNTLLAGFTLDIVCMGSRDCIENIATAFQDWRLRDEAVYKKGLSWLGAIADGLGLKAKNIISDIEARATRLSAKEKSKRAWAKLVAEAPDRPVSVKEIAKDASDKRRYFGEPKPVRSAAVNDWMCAPSVDYPEDAKPEKAVGVVAKKPAANPLLSKRRAIDLLNKLFPKAIGTKHNPTDVSNLQKPLAPKKYRTYGDVTRSIKAASVKEAAPASAKGRFTSLIANLENTSEPVAKPSVAPAKTTFKALITRLDKGNTSNNNTSNPQSDDMLLFPGKNKNRKPSSSRNWDEVSTEFVPAKQPAAVIKQMPAAPAPKAKGARVARELGKAPIGKTIEAPAPKPAFGDLPPQKGDNGTGDVKEIGATFTRGPKNCEVAPADNSPKTTGSTDSFGRVSMATIMARKAAALKVAEDARNQQQSARTFDPNKVKDLVTV